MRCAGWGSDVEAGLGERRQAAQRVIGTVEPVLNRHATVEADRPIDLA